ncbi:ABC transporter substrate-binding protein [Kitasatospora sp. NPDC001603]|uniref:ABC transporter substrate-binding protein n=1 Tax=Kitasatospora sp. NPDC001603 TaxID=3154388 RepID=UPI00332FFC75
MGRTSTTTRVLGTATVAVLALTATACGSGSESTAGGSSGSFAYWSMWRADEAQAKVIKAAIDQFQTDTGIKVDITWAGRDVKKKIGPAIATNQAPDLWDQGADGVYGATAQAGQALDLSDVLGMEVPGEGRKVSDVVPAKYLDALPKDPDGRNHYVIPYEISSGALFYNTADPDIAAAMPSPPASWADFLKVCDALKARGRACLATDGELAWENGLILDYLLSAGGVGFSALSSDPSGAGWDAPAVLTAARQTEQLVKGGHLISGYDATKFPAQETNWAAGKAAFYPDGSWVTDEVAKQLPADWKMGAMLPPGAVNADSMMFGFAIPKKAKHSAAAKRFIAYFLQKKTLAGISTEAGNITPRSDIPAPAALTDIQKALDAAPVRLTYDGVAGDYPTKVFNQNFLDLWHGKTSAEQFVAKMKSDQASFWKSQG